MARYTGPKDKLSRRESFDLFGKGAKLTRLTVPPGIHGAKGYKAKSEYARQLREKQKVKRMYGLLERQFKKYVHQALKSKGNTGEVLLSTIERRLDNVVYRLGLAPTRAAARQVVSHGHVFINGKRVNIPSYQVRASEVISLSKKAMEIPSVKKCLEDKDFKIPSWLRRKGAAGNIVSIPRKEDIPEPISEQDVVEFYSR